MEKNPNPWGFFRETPVRHPLHGLMFYTSHFYLVNRVEHQKLNQTTAELPLSLVFGVQIGLLQIQALISTYYIIIIKRRMRIRRR